MRRLTPLTLVWRNYLYANKDGYYNDSEDFLARVSLIQDEKDYLGTEILKEDPDWKTIQLSKEEIGYQIENLEDMAKDFSEYAKYFLPEPDNLQDLFLDDIKNHGTESDFYQVAVDWQEYANRADEVLKGDFKTEDSMKQQLMEVQLEPTDWKNIQIIKEQQERPEQSAVEELQEAEEIQEMELVR